MNQFLGTYQQIEHDPQKILLDSIKAPINGLYGIEDETGNISFWNYGEPFGAIDVALFIIIIGGFLGVTMKTGAINAGIARVVASMAGRERLMIPILMIIFALGGTTYGMAEETSLFYPLIIPVMIAAGYDALVGASVLLLGAASGSRVDDQPVPPASPPACSVSIAEGLVLRLVILVVGLIIGIVFVMRYAEKVRADPSQSLVYAQKAENEARFPDRPASRSGVRNLHGAPQGRARALLPRLRGHDLRRDPLGGPRHRGSHALVVVPGDDRLLSSSPFWSASPADSQEFDLTGSFVDGARDLLGVALIIGIARGITVIMNNGKITDTVLNWAEGLVADTSGARFVLILFLLFIRSRS